MLRLKRFSAPFNFLKISSMTRKPVVAGTFYPADPSALKKMIRGLAPKTTPNKEDVIACILPHAGYVYSGKVAAAVLCAIHIPSTCIIIGPNHTGNGEEASIMTEGEWQTPLGTIPIDTALAKNILAGSKYLKEDGIAHAEEHSIEVLLPLLQEISQSRISIVPIALASIEDLVYKDTADAIVKAVKKNGKGVLIVASSDMTHYEPHDQAARKDEQAIKAMLGRDDQELLNKVNELQISMCGSVPAAVALRAANALGAKDAKLVAYQTSGDASGDYSSVVGYAGIIIG
jgi:MEMO1 family protein